MNKIKILFLEANPSGTDQLAINEEVRAIERKIRTAKYRDSLELISQWAVRPDDVLESLNEHRPHVVHFSAHGTNANEILFVGNDGEARPVSSEALRALFSTLKDNVRLVVFNACFARAQAEAVADVIDCAIGMNDAIGDEAAIVFAGAFYGAIGYGRSIQEAFDQGKVAIMFEGMPEEQIPQLLVNDDADASKIRLVVDSPSERRAPQLKDAAAMWAQKLGFLEQQLAITAGAAQKFAIQQQIEEAKQKIAELS